MDRQRSCEGKPVTSVSRRALLQRMGAGMGAVGLAGVFAGQQAWGSPLPTVAAGMDRSNPLSAKQPMFAPKAKRIIHLFMNGGPSQVDTFDPKPALAKYDGQRPPGADLKTERKTGGLMKSPFSFSKNPPSALTASLIKSPFP